ncbi:hypothetical protein GIB67_012897 [Kingdonia uniflora]|uniref:Fatty acyl-CoA reductase n=1 Tax=Kingdonia uniflora TaxID=39325 RepID=A0A7J7NG69_9MAGN|nr:hypothetical protein GIB67_012897 [Kingdonia uniflora]
MDMGGIVDSLKDKTILVTGSSGFLAKIFVEKVLRVQPDLKTLYLLLRAADNKAAKQRLHDEMLPKEVFRVLREKMGAGFVDFIGEKIVPVAGDTTCENLGVEDSDLRDKMWRDIDIVVNTAATLKFDERYDIALSTNTLGAKNVLEFAKKCVKLQNLVHVSTAYVCGEKLGLVLEKAFEMGETLNGNLDLDIEHERKLVRDTLDNLRAQGVTKELERAAMKQLGQKRARQYGWPNTYVFTKAMGEMLIGQLRGDLPVSIIRPSIITSTIREPFPGWVEGISISSFLLSPYSHIDRLAIGYGKGKIPCFLGDSELVIDLIPVDMVANAMVVAAIFNANQPSQYICHVSTSLRKPLKSLKLRDYGHEYFSRNPWINEHGKSVKVTMPIVFSTMESFRRYIYIRYLSMLKVLQLLNALFCQYWQGLYKDLNGKIRLVLRLVELYEAYIFFQGVFDDSNAERMRMKLISASNLKADTFYFDPNLIDWNDYIVNIHIPGVVRHSFK